MSEQQQLRFETWIPQPAATLRRAGQAMGDLLRREPEERPDGRLAAFGPLATADRLAPPTLVLSRGIMAGIVGGLTVVGVCLFTAGTFFGLSLGQATAPERGAQLAQTDPNRFLSNDSSVGKVGLEKPKSTFNFEAQAAGIRAQISAASGSAKDPMLETRTWEPLDLSAPERGVKKSAEAVVRGLDQAAAPPPPPILEAATKTAPATKPGPSTKPDKVAVGETVAKSVPPAAPAPAAPVLAEAAPKVVQPKAVQKMPAQTVTIPKPVKTATAALGSAYALQLGAFSDQANAMRLVERLQAKGHQAGVSPVTDAKGRSLHSVRVSGYRSRAEAQAAAALLASTFKVKSFVVGPDTADRG